MRFVTIQEETKFAYCFLRPLADCEVRTKGKRLSLPLLALAILILWNGHALCEVTHAVKSGETLETIARGHRLSVSALKRMNGLTSSKLKVGQKLVITSQANSSVGRKGKGEIYGKHQDSPATAGNEVAGASVRYTLKKGDTPDRLGETFDLTSLPLEPRNNHTLEKWKNEDERRMLVRVAKSFSGAPYRYGGDSIRGLDCSAFVRKIYEIFDVQLPRSTRDQYHAGATIDHSELTAGDLVFFRTKRHVAYPTHVGIYVGENNFIHASSSYSQGVKISSLSEDYYARRFAGAVRVKALSTASSETGYIPSTELVLASQ